MDTVHYRTSEGKLEKKPAPSWPCPIQGCTGTVKPLFERMPIYTKTEDGPPMLVGEVARKGLYMPPVYYISRCTQTINHEFFVGQNNEPSTGNRTRI